MVGLPGSRRVLAALLVLALGAASCSSSSSSSSSTSPSTPAEQASDDRLDYAHVALNVLTPGQGGAVPPGANATDQLELYDGLTPLGGAVTADDLTRFFKSERFGLDGATGTVEPTPRAGLTIERDQWGVPHITGDTRADVEFGAGWVTAHDRGAFIEAIRGPARVATLDVPGLDAFTLATTGRSFTPSSQTERYVAEQADLLASMGPAGARVLEDIDAYVEGINAYYRSVGSTASPWTRNDVIAASSLIGAVFGKGGGDEVRRSELLAGLQARLGVADGRAVFDDLREADDPEAPTTISASFPYEQAPTGSAAGAAVIDVGSLQPVSPGSSPAAAPNSDIHMSNALLVGTSRSATGHPLAVMGPQVGYFYPEFLMELDLHGGGIDARGAAFPGVSLYVLLGRGRDFAWSATTSNSDNIDQFLDELCNLDGSAPTRASTSYLHDGTCVPMTTFDAGMLAGTGGGSPEAVQFSETVHGPVVGTVTVGGRPYAVATARSTRGRDVASALAFADLNANRVASADDFATVMDQVEFCFNWFYVDDRDIAYFSSGRLPIRAAATDPTLPTLGTGGYDWDGFLSVDAHPQAVNPPEGAVLSWNNKPAPGFGAADDNWTYGSVQRVQLFGDLSDHNELEDVVASMNRAATADLGAVEVWPDIARVLTSDAPDPTTQQAADLVTAWASAGGSRLDGDLDGWIDDPGAAILDAAWPHIARAVMTPVLGPLTDGGPATLAAVNPIADPAGPHGSSYFGGWYGYVDKDLRSLLGDDVQAPFSRPYCGAGVVADCRASLWGALRAAVGELSAVQGGEPSAWRADATAERIEFVPGLLPATMRWANRPTFQQVIEFDGHRPR